MATGTSASKSKKATGTKKLVESLRRDRLSCPKCGAKEDKTWYDGPTTFDHYNKVVIFAGCEGCGFEWSEIYTLSTITTEKVNVDPEQE